MNKLNTLLFRMAFWVTEEMNRVGDPVDAEDIKKAREVYFRAVMDLIEAEVKLKAVSFKLQKRYRLRFELSPEDL